MITFIIICAIVFVVIVISFNYQKITQKLKGKEPSKDTTPKPKKEPKYSYEEFKPSVKVDNLKHEDTNLTVESFVDTIKNENEVDSKVQQSGGRLKGDLKSVDNIDVKVEELEQEDDVNKEDIFDFDFFEEQKPSISEQIKNLPPEIKALLVSDLLNKKDD